MNISVRWLRELAPGLTDSPEQLADRLAALGAPVEEILPLGAGIEGVRIARVLEARRHPDADRLSLCQVDGGEGVVQVVCGAPNVRAGIWVALAPVGCALPGGLQIRKAKIRGEVSEGMLCSERELGLGREHGGILELTGDFRPGAPFVEALSLSDTRLDVEVTSNRPDLLSHLGIARELAPGGDAGLSLPPIPGGIPATPSWVRGEQEAGTATFQVRVEESRRAPRYLAAVLRGVRVAPSPPWLQARLRAVGGRPINNVVDATNLVLWELGQPLHAFDLDRIQGETVVVRAARPGERLRTLDGEDRPLPPSILCICDAQHPIALAGIMGGRESEVGETTTSVLLECALFDPPTIRAGRKLLGMSTDASYRFERGVDPAGMERALARCIEVILATAGGSVEPDGVDVAPDRWTRPRIELRTARVERILGIPFSPAAIRDLLEPLGFDLEGTGDPGFRVGVPGYRSWDIRREIDLIEEIARRHGYDRFPDVLRPFRPGTVPEDPFFRLQAALRTHLVGRGFLEGLTLAFVPPSEGDVVLAHPLTVEESRLRRSMLPGLLRRVSFNFHRGSRDVRLFEMGTVFAPPAEPGALPREETRLALVLTGGRTPAHWSGEAAPVDFWDLRGLLEEVVEIAYPGAVPSWVALEGATEFRDGSAVRVLLEGREVARGGEVRPGVVDAPRWAGPVLAFELAFPPAVPLPMAPRYEAIPAHPGIERDLALLIPVGMEAGRLPEGIRQAGGVLLREVTIFDLYDGPGVPEGFRSIGYRLLFRASDRTLSDEEVTPAVEQVLTLLEREYGVVRR